MKADKLSIVTVAVPSGTSGITNVILPTAINVLAAMGHPIGIRFCLSLRSSSYAQ